MKQLLDIVMNYSLPSRWSNILELILEENQIWSLVTLTGQSNEFRKVEDLMKESMAEVNIHTI